MNRLRPSRRHLLRASLIGGIAIYLAPLGSRAFASRRGGLLRLDVGRRINSDLCHGSSEISF